MGERGRQLLKQYDPERYVDALAQFASACLETSPRVSVLQLAGRIGSDLSQWLHPAASDYLLERASQEIYALSEGKQPARLVK